MINTLYSSLSTIPPSTKQVIIHSDGGCEGNPGIGGWAAVLRYGKHVKEISGGCPATTNNRMEMQAAIEALRSLKKPCEVEFFTDSEYLRQGICEWIAKWKKRGWRTTGRAPVKNEDLWRALDNAASVHRIAWKWLKGHAGHVDNERCDQLAAAEMERIRKSLTPQQIRDALQEFKAARATIASPTLL
jgi:ribonuclease HI